MKLFSRFLLLSVSSFLVLLMSVTSALAANEVFLSNDTAQSEVTYVIQFETTVKGHVDKIRIALPPGTNAANARLGRLIIGDKVFEGDDDHKNDATLSVDPPDTLIVDLRDERDVKAGTKILVGLFNLNNPVAGNYAIDVRTLKKNSSILEVIPPIAFSSFATGTGDITAVNTPAGSGLTGGAASGDVSLSLQVCAAGGGVTQVTASAPLASSGGNTPNISLPNVIIQTANRFNTATGSSALSNNTTGSNNTAIGFRAGFNQTNGSNNIYVDNPAVAGESDTIRIGDTQTRTFIRGIRGVTTGSPTAIEVLIDANGQLGTISSSRRYKEEIRDMGEASSGLLRLRPVTFRYKQHQESQGNRPLEYGLIAEEVAAVYPDLVVYNNKGEVETVQYHKLVPMLLNEVQKQHRDIQEQRGEVIGLKAENADLKARLEKLEKMIFAKEALAQK